jgi:AsmA protein
MKKKFWLITAVIIGVVLVAIIALPFMIDADQFRPAIQNELNGMLGREMTIGHLDLSVWRGTLKAADISVSDDAAFSSEPFVRAQSLEVGIDLIPLMLSRTLHIRSISLQKPQVALLRSTSGQWNYSSVGQRVKGKNLPSDPSTEPSGTPEFTVQTLTIIDGRLSIGNSPNRQQTYDGVNVTAENVSYSSPFPFTVKANTPGGGTLQLEGNAGPIDSRDTAQTPFQAKATLKQVDLASTGFLDPSSGIAGKLDYQGEIRSDGRVAHTEGAAKLDKLRLVMSGVPATQPISIDYATDYNLAKQSGQLTKGQILTGKSNLAISGTYDTHGASEEVHMKLNAPNIPVQDIQALLPALGVTLPAGSSLQGGEVKANLSLDGPIERLVTTGDLNISNAKLSGFGLGSKMAALPAFIGVKQSPDTVIKVLSSNLRIAPEGIRLDDLILVVADLGSITGAGTIDANRALNFKMLANVAAGSAIGNLTTRAGLGGGTGRGIPFLIQGTTANPVFVPDAKGMVSAGLSNLVRPLGTDQPQNLGGILGGLVGKKKQ